MKTATRIPAIPLSAVQRQWLDGWIKMLDVDLQLAQKTLRLGDRNLPCPPIAMPAVGDVPAVEAPSELEPAEAPLPTIAPRGAYARRARAGGA